MKRYLVYCCLAGLLIIASCAYLTRHDKGKQASPEASKPILTGWLTPKKIFEKVPEYQSGMDSYQPGPAALDILKSYNSDVNIMVFFGTWCSDSQRDVPRFLKIMDLVQNSHLQYRLLGLDRSKRDSDGFAEKYQIELVPTFIVLQNDEEKGRIVETPMISIEQDLVEILSAGM